MPIVMSAGIERIGWRETWVVSGAAVWVVVIPLTLWALPARSEIAMQDAGHPVAGAPVDDWTRALAARTGMFWAITLAVATNAWSSPVWCSTRSRSRHTGPGRPRMRRLVVAQRVTVADIAREEDDWLRCAAG